MTAKFTPGPWWLTTRTDGSFYTDHGSAWLISADGPVIDFQQNDGDSEAYYKFQNDDDVSLIAAAPDLYEALKRLKSEAWKTSVEQLMFQGNDAVRLANEAIARAEGGHQ